MGTPGWVELPPIVVGFGGSDVGRDFFGAEVMLVDYEVGKLARMRLVLRDRSGKAEKEWQERPRNMKTTEVGASDDSFSFRDL